MDCHSRERKILHLDMDSYFASVEQQQEPSLRGIPIGVSGKPGTRTVVAAASREAKPFGVKSGMPTWEAKELCPQIRFVQGHMENYQKCSRTWLQIMREFSPILEIFSIDEAFLDITDTVERFGGELKLAQQIKKKIRNQLGKYITASIGIAPNKTFAKLVCQKVKPNGIFILKRKNIPALLKNTIPKEICGIGSKTAAKLEKMGISSLAELGNYPLENLKAVFGSSAQNLKLFGQGIDNAPVVPYWQEEKEKSISRSFTLPKEVSTFEAAKPVLFRLAERIARKMRNKNVFGNTITLQLRNLNFKTQTRQKSISYYTQDAREIFATCVKLYKKFKGFENIRLVGIRVSNLTKEKNMPQNMFKTNWQELTKTVDKINQHFGEKIVHATSLPANKILKPPIGYNQEKVKPV
ncbi:MAG: DNA polymerase IV [Patescibacteria group bacterium]|nr:DNA polymerase IV [Patescibacteria group bacterium]